MKLNEMSPVLTPVISKKATKTFNAVKKALKPYGPAVFEMKTLSETSVEITADFQRWLAPETILDAYQEMEYTIKKADEEGHLFKVEVGNGVGADFVEAILSGLRPGMPVKAEAFFPLLAYEVTWKNIIKK
jgi:hypothetical protein